MDSLAYKSRLDDTLARLRSLYERRAVDRIFALFEIPGPALALFRAAHPEGFCSYPDPAERIAFWNDMLCEHAAIEDDSVPSAYLSEFDQGLYGGLLGGEVQFMCHDNGWISSMVAPILADWSEFESLLKRRPIAGQPWFVRFLRQLDIFRAGAEGKFGISHFILIDGLNFAFELVGATRTYESLFDAPDMVRRAIDLGFEVNLEVQRTFFERTPCLRGGTFSNMVQWIPGTIVSESVDPFHMTSAGYFEEWGRANIERMFGSFDGGVLHLHGNGRHLLEAVCTIRGLKAIWMGDDRGYPPAFDILDDLRRRAGDLPLVVQTDFAEFIEKLNHHALTGGVLYHVTGAPDAATANRCMEKVRAYRV
jgi:hypothetical protein